MVEVTKRISTLSLERGARDWTARSVDVSTAGLPGDLFLHYADIFILKISGYNSPMGLL